MVHLLTRAVERGRLAAHNYKEPQEIKTKRSAGSSSPWLQLSDADVHHREYADVADSRQWHWTVPPFPAMRTCRTFPMIFAKAGVKMAADVLYDRYSG